ncbi:hypothetical protein AB0K93_10480 [Streptomyces sp. NPDC052676]|uniref:hypothetical protein n=1 Tax=Streptomyces sp. NPDC052676 TaxID=3154953 RepID=UPI00341D89D0
MTDETSTRRVPDAPEQVVHVRTEPRPDGSTTLAQLTVGPPLVLIEHRMHLDRYLTRALLHALARDLNGIQAESAALLNALRTGDRDAFTTALDAYNARILSLWTDGGATR